MSSKNKLFLSIIIPNYNSGKLLRRCLESILVATEGDYEIIVVDDGSTDKSLSFVPKDSHIKLIRQENKGVASARNIGIRNANAEYFMFVDADDTLDTEWYSTCKQFEVGNTDLVVFNYYSRGKLIKLTERETHYNSRILSSFIEKALKDPTRYMTVWGKLFKRQTIVENNLEFNCNLSLAEDGDFLLKYLFMISSIIEMPNVLYNYHSNGQSVMHTFDNHKVQGYLIALNESQKTIIDQKNQQVIHWFNFYILMHFNIMMVHEVFDIDNSQNWHAKLNELKQVLAKPIIRGAVKNIKLTECNALRMVPVLLLKLHLYSLAGILYVIRSRQNHQ